MDTILGLVTLPAFTHGLLQATVLAYVGPDQILPLTSILGAIGGLLLMFWNRFLGLLRWARNLRPGRAPQAQPGAETDTSS